MPNSKNTGSRFLFVFLCLWGFLAASSPVWGAAVENPKTDDCGYGAGGKDANDALLNVMVAIRELYEKGTDTTSLRASLFDLQTIPQPTPTNLCSRSPFVNMYYQEDLSDTHHSKKMPDLNKDKCDDYKTNDYYYNDETVLTYAVKIQFCLNKTGNNGNKVNVLGLVLKAVNASNGNVDASNFKGRTPYQIVADKRSYFFKEEGNSIRCALIKDKASLSITDADNKICNQGKSNKPSKLTTITSRLSGWDATSPATPDTVDKQADIPDYVSTLLSSNQGVTVNVKDVSGASQPSVAGEVRYTMDTINSPFNYTDFREGLSSGVNHYFLFAGANISPQSTKLQQLKPEWASWGSGVNQVFYPTPRSPEDFNEGVTSWVSTTERIGRLESRVRVENQLYNFASLSISEFSPMLPSRWTGKNHPVYFSATAGEQIQYGDSNASPVAGVTGSSSMPMVAPPRSYKYARLDIYAYPCELFGTIKTPVTSVTMHLSSQVVNDDAGHLNEMDLSWQLTKSVSLSVSRSIGIQDPLTTFGIIPTATAVTSFGLKIK